LKDIQALAGSLTRKTNGSFTISVKKGNSTSWPVLVLSEIEISIEKPAVMYIISFTEDPSVRQPTPAFILEDAQIDDYMVIISSKGHIGLKDGLQRHASWSTKLILNALWMQYLSQSKMLP
jgi:hypothetical protein